MGQSSSRSIKSTILIADCAGGHMALVVLEDNAYAITRNGELLPDHCWEAPRMDECIDVFLKLTRNRGNAR